MATFPLLGGLPSAVGHLVAFELVTSAWHVCGSESQGTGFALSPAASPRRVKSEKRNDQFLAGDVEHQPEKGGNSAASRWAAS